MFQVALGCLGLLLVATAMGDMIATTMTVRDGGGWLSRHTTRAAWRAWRAVGIHLPSWLSHGGALVVLTIFAQWTALLWAGWSLVVTGFFPSEGPAVARVFSLLIGRGSPTSDVPTWLALAMGLTGVVFVSLTISYIVAIVSAVAYMRHVAAYLRTLGERPEEVLDAFYDGGDPAEDLDLHLIALTPMLLHVGTKFLAFPVLHTFQPARASEALSVRLAVLLLALERRDESGASPMPRAAERPFRRAVLDLLRMYGHPTQDAAEGESRSYPLRAVRRWVERSGWSWDRDVSYVEGGAILTTLERQPASP